FNVDSLYWIAIDWNYCIPTYTYKPNYYLVRYNKSKYLIPKNIAEKRSIVKPLGKKKRIYQERELLLYYHPTLILWHPDGHIDEIPDTTDLYIRLVE
ncbi:MAG: hypothetical protein K2M65_04865, partial [Muribaculaceae bacterium]|nr:hypothetical protein [Muribaculaceae bacterium]